MSASLPFWKKNPATAAAVLVFILLLLVRMVTGFNGLAGQDSYEYLRYAQDVFSAEDRGSFFWPVLYPLMGALGGALTGHHDLWLQVLSIAATAGVVWYCTRILTEFCGAKAIPALWFCVIVVGLAPFLFRTGLQIMSDTVSLFFSVGCVYYALRYGKAAVLSSLLLAATCAAFAFTSRYASAVLCLPAGVFVLVQMIRQKHWMHLAAGVVCAAVAALPHFSLKGVNPEGMLGHNWLVDWSPGNFVKDGFLTADGATSYPFINLFYSFSVFVHPGFFTGGTVLLFLLILFRKKIPSTVLILSGATVALYCIFLAGIPFQNTRFLLFAWPFIAILYYLPLEAVAEKFRLNRYLVIALFMSAAALQMVLCYRGLLPALKMQKVEDFTASVAAARPGSTLYCLGMKGAMQYRNVPNTVKEIFNESISGAKSGDLIVYRPVQWGFQWKGKPPAQAWAQLTSQFDTVLIGEPLPDWRVYELR